jgi:hypothetical protein
MNPIVYLIQSQPIFAPFLRVLRALLLQKKRLIILISYFLVIAAMTALSCRFKQ